MKCMPSRSMAPGSYQTAVERFLSGGAPMPEGLTSSGRYPALGSYRGWLMCEADDPGAVAQHVSEWATLLNIEVTPVIEDEEAGAAAARVYAT